MKTQAVNDFNTLRTSLKLLEEHRSFRTVVLISTMFFDPWKRSWVHTISLSGLLPGGGHAQSQMC